jgi:hypothetical protein
VGYFNAQLGGENKWYKKSINKHGPENIYQNGEMLANLCAKKEIVIGESLLPHLRIHEATWISLNHKTENQIHYVCISRRFRRFL